MAAFVLPIGFTTPLHAQDVEKDTLDHSVTHRISVELHPSYVVPTHKFIKWNNSKGKPIRAALSGHIKYGFQFAKGSRFAKLYPTAYQGIGLGYNRFLDSDDFGHPLAVYAFQGAPLAQIRPNLTFGYEWNFGVSFGWKEFDPIFHYKNHVIGTDLDAYMNLAFLFNWKFKPHWQLNAGLSLTHCSNANTHYPNQGINLIESKIGITRTFGTVEEGLQSSLPRPALREPRRISYDLILFSGFRIREMKYEGTKYIPDEKFMVYGLNFTPMYHFNNRVKAGASLDFQYDESSNLPNYITGVTDNRIQYTRQPFHERLTLGLSIRGEWAMPIFSINAGIGYNLYAKSFDQKRFYQVLAMKLFLCKRFFLHIGYQMNQFKDPNNLMLGAGVRLH